MNYEEILVEVADGIAVVTLNRPRRLNAYTPDMGEELVTALRRLLKDDKVRAVVLTGAGRGFCAGADREYLDGKRGRCGYVLGEEPFIRDFAAELAYAGKPLIAAINGIATGIGLTMVLPFDVRVATNEAAFGFPFVKLDIVPGLGSTFFLPRLIGVARTRELILSAATVDAQQALAMGLISEVVPAEQLLHRAVAVAQSMACHEPSVIEACKRALILGENASLPEAMAYERLESRKLRRRTSEMH